MSEKSIIYLNHGAIDYKRWDACIESAPDTRVYAATWYLDRAAGIWDALVWGDYEYVMPLTLRKKFGIKYLYQPVFSQQLGIFPQPPQDIAVLFYKELTEKFRYIDIQLNSGNLHTSMPPLCDILERDNYLLEMDTDYKIISDNYSGNTKRNIEKAYSNNLSLSPNISLDEYIRFNRENLQPGLDNNDLKILKSIIAYSQHMGFGEIPGIYTHNNNLCATVFFCCWRNRIIYLNAASSDEGKKYRAMFLLLDQFIKKNAGKKTHLDFEGSMIPGVARFYKGFGAQPEQYYRLRYNNLPLPVKWLKR
jgi:hypothetical protein